MLDQVDILSIINIAKKAGDAILQVYTQPFEVEYKERDGSPLTLADSMSSTIIENSLNKLPINFPILSEEGAEISYRERKEWEYFWLVDPLDGTKEFVSKNGEFTVNIALIHGSEPILGVVYAPTLDICYWAVKGKGAFKNGRKLPILKKQSEVYRIVASRSHMSNATQTFIREIKTKKRKEVVNIGSSLKICLVAEGAADIYPRIGPTMEWDTAAAHAIVNESGKTLRRFNDGAFLVHAYNKKNLLNDSFVVM